MGTPHRETTYSPARLVVTCLADLHGPPLGGKSRPRNPRSSQFERLHSRTLAVFLRLVSSARAVSIRSINVCPSPHAESVRLGKSHALIFCKFLSFRIGISSSFRRTEGGIEAEFVITVTRCVGFSRRIANARSEPVSRCGSSSWIQIRSRTCNCHQISTVSWQKGHYSPRSSIRCSYLCPSLTLLCRSVYRPQGQRTGRAEVGKHQRGFDHTGGALFERDWSGTKTPASAAPVAVEQHVIERIQRLKTLTVEVRAGHAVRRHKVIKSCGPRDLVFQSVWRGKE